MATIKISNLLNGASETCATNCSQTDSPKTAANSLKRTGNSDAPKTEKMENGTISESPKALRDISLLQEEDAEYSPISNKEVDQDPSSKLVVSEKKSPKHESLGKPMSPLSPSNQDISGRTDPLESSTPFASGEDPHQRESNTKGGGKTYREESPAPKEKNTAHESSASQKHCHRQDSKGSTEKENYKKTYPPRRSVPQKLRQCSSYSILQKSRNLSPNFSLRLRRAQRRFAVAAAKHERGSEFINGTENGEFEVGHSLDKRMKNRAAVNKCRLKQKERLEQLTEEQEDLIAENKLLRELLETLEKNQLSSFLKKT